MTTTQNLRSQARALVGCTLCARGRGLRLSYLAPDLATLHAFVSEALARLLTAGVAPVLLVRDTWISIEAQPENDDVLSTRHLALARRLSKLALASQFKPRLSKTSARRPLEPSRKRPASSPEPDAQP
jgi:hypothetical protein